MIRHIVREYVNLGIEYLTSDEFREKARDWTYRVTAPMFPGGRATPWLRFRIQSGIFLRRVLGMTLGPWSVKRDQADAKKRARDVPVDVDINAMDLAVGVRPDGDLTAVAPTDLDEKITKMLEEQDKRDVVDATKIQSGPPLSGPIGTATYVPKGKFFTY